MKNKWLKKIAFLLSVSCITISASCQKEEIQKTEEDISLTKQDIVFNSENIEEKIDNFKEKFPNKLTKNNVDYNENNEIGFVDSKNNDIKTWFTLKQLENGLEYSNINISLNEEQNIIVLNFDIKNKHFSFDFKYEIKPKVLNLQKQVVVDQNNEYEHFIFNTENINDKIEWFKRNKLQQLTPYKLYFFKENNFVGFKDLGDDPEKNTWFELDDSTQTFDWNEVFATIDYNDKTIIIEYPYEDFIIQKIFEYEIKEDINSNQNQTNKSKKPSNSKFQYDENKTVFVRPPFGAKFKLKGVDLPPIVTVFAHLDSPGTKTGFKNSTSKTESKYVEETAKRDDVKINAKNGAQEISEFFNIPHILNIYRFESNKENSLVIFGGDTNIDKKNFSLDKVFPNEVHRVLRNLGEEGELKYFTSLGHLVDSYRHPYDKMYYLNGEDENYDVINQKDNPELKFKVDIWKGFEDQIWSKQEMQDLNGYQDVSVRWKAVSDHAPVFVDVNIKKGDITSNESTVVNYPKNNKNLIRIAHWNILKYNGSDSELFKENAIAQLIAKTGMDIVGFTEVSLGSGEKVQRILDILNNKLNKNFKMVIQDRDEATWNNTGYDHFTQETSEQIVIIYDANIFDLDKFRNKKNGLSFKETFKTYGVVKRK
ncbi:hypothetical protein [Mycoplasma leonicaptivi]|uniref:hypothetical protein n=1 Tax=Mycoplasma leonicaptivi TaxID=36742 RepID=UPI0004805B5F|nr:hypothetical protein [Mycoplasma leonicaptivi]